MTLIEDLLLAGKECDEIFRSAFSKDRQPLSDKIPVDESFISRVAITALFHHYTQLGAINGVIPDWMEGIRKTRPDDDIVSVRDYLLLRWFRGGCPRFRVSHSLATQLAMTDPNGLKGDAVHFPFPVFIVELPEGGPLLVESKKKPKDVWKKHNAVEPTFLLVGTTEMRKERGGFGFLTLSGNRHGAIGLKSTQLYPEINTGLLVTTEELAEANNRHKAKYGEEFGTGITLDDAVRFQHLAACLVVNLALYLVHTPSGQTSSGRTVNHDHGLQSLLYEVGSEIKLNKELRDAARAYCRAGTKSAGWTLAKRFVVRGHWKQQPYGSGRSERKLIFVEPYWKGPADTPVVSNAYVPRDPDE